MSKEELKLHYDIITDVWKLFHKYSDIKNTDEYWKALVTEAKELPNRYGANGTEHPYAVKLVADTLTEIKRIWANG